MGSFKIFLKSNIALEFIALFVVLFILNIIPNLYLWSLKKSDGLETYIAEGEISFEWDGKKSYLIVIDGNQYTCAVTMWDSHDCTYYPIIGQKGDSRIHNQADILSGKKAVVRWAEVSTSPWTHLRTIIELKIDDKRYRKPLDYDVELEFSKSQIFWSSLNAVFLVFFLIWLRFFFKK